MLLHELNAELTLLAETDPDKNVRSAAAHALREAIELNVAEQARLSRESDRDELAKLPSWQFNQVLADPRGIDASPPSRCDGGQSRRTS